ncbi:hypothetical protein N0V90_002411 [Kalmusia sp. IMI 367209]|nr:hypothetical protein N0V90_002411 [Kalmusia sp. IMI 367209]
MATTKTNAPTQTYRNILTPCHPDLNPCWPHHISIPTPERFAELCMMQYLCFQVFVHWIGFLVLARKFVVFIVDPSPLIVEPSPFDVLVLPYTAARGYFGFQSASHRHLWLWYVHVWLVYGLHDALLVELQRYIIGLGWGFAKEFASEIFRTARQK